MIKEIGIRPVTKELFIRMHFNPFMDMCKYLKDVKESGDLDRLKEEALLMLKVIQKGIKDATEEDKAGWQKEIEDKLSGINDKLEE